LKKYLALIPVFIIIGAIVAYYTYNGSIALNIGIISSVVFGVLFPVFLAVLSPIADYMLKERTEIAISDIELKQTYTGSDAQGYKINSLVTNKGKKNCLNVKASIQIIDSSGKTPDLLFMNYEEENGEMRKVEVKSVPMQQLNYAWDINNSISTALDKLLQDDVVRLIYPHQESYVGLGAFGSHNTTTYSNEYLLNLKKSKKYAITITVKGEDSDGCTAMGKKRKTFVF
jgi:hypothetical protein